MSTWTHVSGIIRYDDLMSTPQKAYEDMRYIEQEFFLDIPSGSEGPIKYSVIPKHEYKKEGNATLHGPHLCDAAFSGDLRDFSEDDWTKLREWFDRATTSDGLDVRQAVMLIEDESYPVSKQEIITFREKISDE